MRQEFELKADLAKSILFLLDAILELGIGIFVLTRPNPDTILLMLGWTFIVVGGIQFIRKFKTILIVKH